MLVDSKNEKFEALIMQFFEARCTRSQVFYKVVDFDKESLLNFDANIKKNLYKFIKFYSSWNHQKTYSFLVISRGAEVSYVMRIKLLNISSEIWQRFMTLQYSQKNINTMDIL